MLAGPVRFAHFRFDPSTRELFKRGRRVRLGEKPARVLAALLARPGVLVARRELRELLWDDETFVDFDNNLNSAVASLREILGDSASAPKYIQTLPRLGYRFVGAVETEVVASVHESATPAVDVTTAAAEYRELRTTHARRTALAITLLLLAIAGGPGGASRWDVGQRAADTPVVRDVRYLLARGTPRDLQLGTEMIADLAARADAPPDLLEVLAEIWLARALGAPSGDAFARAEASAHRALAADRRRGGAWRTLAGVELYRDRDPGAAAALAARAIASDPVNPAVHLMAATVDAARGRYDAAVASAATAVRLDPSGWRVRADLAFFLLAAGRYGEALAESRATLALEPESPFVRDMLLTAAERSGALADARDAAVTLMAASRAAQQEIAAVRAGSPREGLLRYRGWQRQMADSLAERAGWPPLAAAAIYAGAGDALNAVRWLRRAEQVGDPMLALLPAMRDFDPVRGDPAFRAFVTGRKG